MTKEYFLKLIANAECFNSELDRWAEFGIELFELPIAEISWDFFNIVIQSAFTNEGVDIINWWLFEKRISCEEVLEIRDNSGSIIPSDTIEDLWNIVKEYRK